MTNLDTTAGRQRSTLLPVDPTTPTHDTDGDTMRLTRSGWVARNITPGHSLWLDYEGVQFKRSQRVVRYHDGTDGYDWPEVVPPSVRAKVARLLDGGE